MERGTGSIGHLVYLDMLGFDMVQVWKWNGWDLLGMILGLWMWEYRMGGGLKLQVGFWLD